MRTIEPGLKGIKGHWAWRQAARRRRGGPKWTATLPRGVVILEDDPQRRDTQRRRQDRLPHLEAANAARTAAEARPALFVLWSRWQVRLPLVEARLGLGPVVDGWRAGAPAP